MCDVIHEKETLPGITGASFLIIANNLFITKLLASDKKNIIQLKPDPKYMIWTSVTRVFLNRYAALLNPYNDVVRMHCVAHCASVTGK